MSNPATCRGPSPSLRRPRSCPLSARPRSDARGRARGRAHGLRSFRGAASCPWLRGAAIWTDVSILRARAERATRIAPPSGQGRAAPKGPFGRVGALSQFGHEGPRSLSRGEDRFSVIETRFDNGAVLRAGETCVTFPLSDKVPWISCGEREHAFLITKGGHSQSAFKRWWARGATFRYRNDDADRARFQPLPLIIAGPNSIDISRSAHTFTFILHRTSAVARCDLRASEGGIWT